MKLYHFALTIVFTVSGCAGGIIGNLIPAPKILKGNIIESRYNSPQNSFSVLTPFPEGSADFTYMSVKEKSKGGWENVVFQSSTKPHSIYRIETGIANPEDKVRSAAEYANESFLHFQENYKKSGMISFEPIDKGEIVLSGKLYEYRIASYRVPSKFLLGNLSTTRPYTGWLILLVHAQPAGVIYQSYDFEEECRPCRDGNLRQILEKRNDISRMVNSLQVPSMK